MEFLRVLEGLRTPLGDAFFSMITHLGEETIFIVVGLLFFWCINKKQGYFVLAVGYRRTVYKKENITENDILIIDAWDGKLEMMDKTIDSNARELYHKPNERWRTEVFK